MRESVPEERAVLDVEHLRVICGDDPEFEREIIGDFVGQAEPHLSRLATAVAAGDAAEVRLVAHALTGSGRSLGAVAFGEACARLERVGKGGELADAPHALALVQAEWKRLRVRLDAHRDRSAA